MGTPTPGGGPTSLGMAPNVAGLLCYVPCCVGLAFSAVAAIAEKRSSFLRFHALQSLLLHAVGLGAIVILSFLQLLFAIVGLGPLAGVLYVLMMVAFVALGATLVLLMIKANGGEEFELPVIGPMAHQWA